MTDSTVIINSPLELECHASGTPAPAITYDLHLMHTDKQIEIHMHTHTSSLTKQLLFFPGGIRMENQSDRARGCGWQPAVDGWSFPALRSRTRLVFSAWPLMKQETTRGTSMWLSMVTY